jgi:hypothetical protein
MINDDPWMNGYPRISMDDPWILLLDSMEFMQSTYLDSMDDLEPTDSTVF